MAITRKWFTYNGAPGGQQNPQNYFYTSNHPSCSLGKCICAIFGIYVGGSGTHPGNFSSRMQLYISDALALGTPQPPFGIIYVKVQVCF